MAAEGGDPHDVFAAGGIVLRGSGPDTEVLVVHRPRYDDWTLPKGKADPGETSTDTALREVEEETALTCHVTGRGGVTSYDVSAGRKRVEYFTMRPLWDLGFEPNDEVDETRWLGIDETISRLTYAFDGGLLTRLDMPAATAATVTHLVRHGAAGDRSKWERPDEERPLTTKGHRQADGVADRLASTGVERILSSPYVRCMQTVEPLGERLGIKVEAHEALAEDPERKALADLLDEVAGTTSVMCSHGDVIPAMLDRLQWMGVTFRSEYACKKGSTWSIVHDGERFGDAVYRPPPATS